MYIQSGIVKANKRDIECIKTFLIHAQIDMDYSGEGSYGTNARELKKGKEGMDNIKMLLRGLCDKWN